MPIVDVEIVGSESVGRDLAARLAEMAGQVFGSPPASTWVRVRLLPRHLYAENATELGCGVCDRSQGPATDRQRG
jgi:phenylpyruvate tautomerase PptA (4-oxalocrotonate tautomerase family)